MKKKRRGNPKVNEFDKSIWSRPDFHINTLLMVCACGASIHIIGDGWWGEELSLSSAGCWGPISALPLIADDHISPFIHLLLWGHYTHSSH